MSMCQFNLSLHEGQGLDTHMCKSNNHVLENINIKQVGLTLDLSSVVLALC